MNGKQAKRLRRDLRLALEPGPGEDNPLAEALVERCGTRKLAREFRRHMAREERRIAAPDA
jgi:hypothetical protein